MSILSKILLGLVVIAVFPVLFFSAAVLKVQSAWRSHLAQFQQAIDKEKQENFDLLHGDARARVSQYKPGRPTEGKVGILQYQTALDNLKVGRGRYWYATRIGESFDPQAGRFKIKILDDDVENSGNRQPLKEHGIKDKAFLYLFQIKHDGTQSPGDDRYVGEFVVDGLTLDENGVPTDADVPLKPSLPLTDAQWTEVKGGSGIWLVYEYMPNDDHAVFNDLPEEEIRTRVPEAVAAEYMNDDKPPTDAVLNDEHLKQFVIEDKDTGTKLFLRPLRDYQAIFRNVALQVAEMNDRLVILNKEKEYADRAKVKVEQLIASLDARKAKLEAEKVLMASELQVVETQRAKLEALLAQVQQDLQTRLADNKRLAAELSGVVGKQAAWQPVEPAVVRTP